MTMTSTMMLLLIIVHVLFTIQFKDCFGLSLQKLVLTRNEISEIHQMAFNGLKTLEDLDISHNQLNKAPSISSVKNTILQLDLSGNKLSHLSDTYFRFCKKIRKVSLNRNQLAQIPNIEYIAQTIVFLSLNSNYISKLTPMYGIRFPRLQTLYLANNQIRRFCFPPVNIAPKIEMVNMRSNYLQAIYFSGAHSPRNPMVYIILYGNPLHCNESLGWIEQCIQESFLNTMTCSGWFIVQGMICASPPEAQGLIPKEAGWICISQSYTCKRNVLHQNRVGMGQNDTTENMRPYVQCSNTYKWYNHTFFVDLEIILTVWEILE